MSLFDKISSFFELSTPLVDDNIEKLLSNRKFREQLLEAIDKERKSYTSEKKDESIEEGIKRVGEFEFTV